MKIIDMLKKMTAFSFMLLVGGCVRVPEGIKPVTNLDVNRYLGTWYEIARFDHSFERGLESVTAEYSLREDGGLQVINRGYNPVKNTWKEVKGRAYFVNARDAGQLKVSFFGPFYGGYNIISLDQENYSYALVCGPSRKYLWILSRTPTLGERKVQELISMAKSLGFETNNLIFVKHDQRKLDDG